MSDEQKQITARFKISFIGYEASRLHTMCQNQKPMQSDSFLSAIQSSVTSTIIDYNDQCIQLALGHDLVNPRFRWDISHEVTASSNVYIVSFDVTDKESYKTACEVLKECDRCHKNFI